MITACTWHESYKAALLETDSTKMQERIQAVESAMHERQRVLSENHGGTPEERQAIADAKNGLRGLRSMLAVLYLMRDEVPANPELFDPHARARIDETIARIQDLGLRFISAGN